MFGFVLVGLHHLSNGLLRVWFFLWFLNCCGFFFLGIWFLVLKDSEGIFKGAGFIFWIFWGFTVV